MPEFVLIKDGFSKRDISQIVRIHRTEISQGFLSSLGNKGLELIFFNATESESGLLIIADDKANGQICGFICGTTNLGGFYRDFMIKKSFGAFIHIAPKLLSPAKLRKMLETLTFPTKKQVVEMPSATLLDIAVSERYQGSGVAQLLFHEFIKDLKGRGISKIKIPSGETQTRAHRFYEKLGAQKLASIEVHRNQTTRVYTFEITGTAQEVNDASEK